MKKELKLAFKYLRRYWLKYLLGILALFIVDRVNAAVPLLSGELIDGLTTRAETGFGMADIGNIVLRLLIMGTVVNVGRFAWRYFLFGSARSVERDLRRDLFAHLETLSMRYYNEHKTGDLMAHFTNDLMSDHTRIGRCSIGPVVDPDIGTTDTGCLNFD